MLGSYEIRTDLALEAREQFTEKNMEIRGVEVRENYDEEKDIRTTVVKVTTENGAKAMGRPQGNYITIEAPGLSMPDEDYHREIFREIATHLRNLISLERETSILVAGLGNSAITADSLGTSCGGKSPDHKTYDKGIRIKESGKRTDAPHQWDYSRCNGADRNGNFRDP